MMKNKNQQNLKVQTQAIKNSSLTNIKMLQKNMKHLASYQLVQ